MNGLIAGMGGIAEVIVVLLFILPVIGVIILIFGGCKQLNRCAEVHDIGMKIKRLQLEELELRKREREQNIKQEIKNDTNKDNMRDSFVIDRNKGINND